MVRSKHTKMPDAPSAIIDVVSGVTAGCAGVFVGQPFDTVRSNSQSLT